MSTIKPIYSTPSSPSSSPPVSSNRLSKIGTIWSDFLEGIKKIFCCFHTEKKPPPLERRVQAHSHNKDQSSPRKDSPKHAPRKPLPNQPPQIKKKPPPLERRVQAHSHIEDQSSPRKDSPKPAPHKPLPNQPPQIKKKPPPLERRVQAHSHIEDQSSPRKDSPKPAPHKPLPNQPSQIKRHSQKLKHNASPRSSSQKDSPRDVQPLDASDALDPLVVFDDPKKLNELIKKAEQDRELVSEETMEGWVSQTLLFPQKDKRTLAPIIISYLTFYYQETSQEDFTNLKDVISSVDHVNFFTEILERMGYITQDRRTDFAVVKKNTLSDQLEEKFKSMIDWLEDQNPPRKLSELRDEIKILEALNAFIDASCSKPVRDCCHKKISSLLNLRKAAISPPKQMGEKNQFNYYGGSSMCGFAAGLMTYAHLENSAEDESQIQDCLKMAVSYYQQAIFYLKSQEPATRLSFSAQDQDQFFYSYEDHLPVDTVLASLRLKPSDTNANFNSPLESGNEYKNYRSVINQFAASLKDKEEGAKIGGLMLSGNEYYSIVMTKTVEGIQIDFFDSHGCSFLTSEDSSSPAYTLQTKLAAKGHIDQLALFLSYKKRAYSDQNSEVVIYPLEISSETPSNLLPLNKNEIAIVKIGQLIEEIKKPINLTAINDILKQITDREESKRSKIKGFLGLDSLIDGKEIDQPRRKEIIENFNKYIYGTLKNLEILNDIECLKENLDHEFIPTAIRKLVIMNEKKWFSEEAQKALNELIENYYLQPKFKKNKRETLKILKELQHLGFFKIDDKQLQSQSPSSLKEIKDILSKMPSTDAEWKACKERYDAAVKKYPKKKDLQPELNLVRNKLEILGFYLYDQPISRGDCAGATLQELTDYEFLDDKELNARYVYLEKQHQFIQWFFPTLSSSIAQPNTPHTYDDVIDFVTTQPQFSGNFFLSFKMMLSFYGFKVVGDSEITSFEQPFTLERAPNFKERVENVYKHQHNFPRMTRMLTSLTEHGFQEAAQVLHDTLVESYGDVNTYSIPQPEQPSKGKKIRKRSNPQLDSKVKAFEIELTKIKNDFWGPFKKGST